MFSQQYTAADAQRFQKTYCVACHQGKSPAGGFNILQPKLERWNTALTRVRNSEMPPKGSPAPGFEEREKYTSWLYAKLEADACADSAPAPASVARRLNRTQYSATMRDLLNLHTLDLGNALPADGAGGEGFDNAAETLFLSPIHAEKYLDAAKTALNYAAKEPRSRAKFLIAKPGDGLTPEQAAQKILAEFLPRAFRRPIAETELEPFMALFRHKQKAGEKFEDSILFALRAVLVSPQFLFRIPAANSDYALASRLSYFLWNSMPDTFLTAVAESGHLREPEVLKTQVVRMLRNQKSFDFAQSFVEQWLGTRDLGHTITPDAKLYPMYAGDEELQGDIRYQPVMFFREIFANNLSLLNFIDSNFTITTRKLQKLYGLSNLPAPKAGNNGQPHRIELPEGSDRGGLLGMAAVLAVSSHPHRTSPVLRGKWLLDAILGTPPPPPPPNVPPLEEAQNSEGHPKTVREMLTRHRENPGCASCHARIDPLGFALENYDVLGRWRTEESGKPIDAEGELPDGTRFDGPKELKQALMQRKTLFVRNLTRKLMGYALGRGLTLKDSCTVDATVEKLEKSDYSAQALIESIVFTDQFLEQRR